MAVIIKDRVQESTTTAGTGALTLGGASAGYVAFSSVMSVGDTCRYCISDPVTNAWEVGNGTYSGANTLSRTTVEASSSGGGLISLAGSAGTVVFLDLSAAQVAALASLAVAGTDPVPQPPGTAAVGSSAKAARADHIHQLPPRFSPTADGLTPLSGGGTATFLRADGTWSAPPGGGGTLGSTPRVIDGSTIPATSGTPYQMVTGDYVVAVNKTTGAPTSITLPTSPTIGQVYYIVDLKGDAATNNITVSAGSGTINGAATSLMNAAYDGLALLPITATAWVLV